MKSLKPRIFKRNGKWTYTFSGVYTPILPGYDSWETCLWWALRVSEIVNDGEDFIRVEPPPTTWRSI